VGPMVGMLFKHFKSFNNLGLLIRLGFGVTTATGRPEGRGFRSTNVLQSGRNGFGIGRHRPGFDARDYTQLLP
jgi:hypothetical protein